MQKKNLIAESEISIRKPNADEDKYNCYNLESFQKKLHNCNNFWLQPKNL